MYPDVNLKYFKDATNVLIITTNGTYQPIDG